ncbi:MAG: polysaccharide deacetylase [Epulopiscium sp. Nuni2H_MBin001]|nr:MAG: polysaccharide deacetylase [Epulopiscium sp. Nuni2H_MBin001]
MKSKAILITIVMLLPIIVYASGLDNTKVDWWIVREKDHKTPRVNDKLSYKLEDYDAYYVGDTEKPVLYLTFDEGYENGQTGAILDSLKENDVPAIFFVTSPYLADNADLITRMVDEGHLVVNHSHHHPSMPKYAINARDFALEFKDVEDKYEKITGKSMVKLFRPPMGHYSQKSLAMTKDLGYQTIFWSFAYADFDVNKQPDPTNARKLISENFHNGAIILLHAVSKTNAQILGDVIKDAKAQGYTFELWPYPGAKESKELKDLDDNAESDDNTESEDTADSADDSTESAEPAL